MTIRVKLALAMMALVVVTTAAVGWGVLAVSWQFHLRDASRNVEMLRASTEKYASDALLQKDELALVSYANFMRAETPWLSRVSITWMEKDRAHKTDIGAAPQSQPQTYSVTVRDAGDPERAAVVLLEVDGSALSAFVSGGDRRLLRIILLVGALTLLAGLALAIWISGSLIAPLTRLDRLASEIAHGRLGGSMAWESSDEIGRLVRSFNTMSRRLEELDEAKKSFVSAVTHELRSPLGAIESFLALIESRVVAAAGPDAAQCREYIGRIKGNIERLSRFINDLLDVAKIEKGRMECSLRPMDLEAVVTDVCQFFSAKARQQGVSLAVSLPILPAVNGDPDRLRQVLVNLISNALKFTPSGGKVTVEARLLERDAKRLVEVLVRDTGSGMEQKDVAVLFQAFSQGQNASQRVVGNPRGTGLGLFIAKSIVDQHGGRIGVTSAPGRGTEVSFSVAVA